MIETDRGVADAERVAHEWNRSSPVESVCGVLAETKSVRLDAEAVLAELLREREEAERRMTTSNRVDHYKAVAGTSSFDRAIDETRRMIRRLDAADGVEIVTRVGASAR